jgi:hypothetical protein
VGETLALFADCLIVGCLTVLAALGVVTAYPALVAGTALLRDRTVADAGVGPRTYWARLRAVARSGPAGFVVPAAGAALLGLDAVAVLAGVPGGRPLGYLLIALTAGGTVLGLRVAGVWRPGERWGPVARAATLRALLDPWGDALLLGAAATAVAVVCFVPITIVLMPGMLALAAAAVERRHPTR